MTETRLQTQTCQGLEKINEQNDEKLHSMVDPVYRLPVSGHVSDFLARALLDLKMNP